MSRVARVFMIIVLAAMLAVVVVALRWRQLQDQEREAACKKSVAAREDNRAMWVWLLQQADPNEPLAAEAQRQLDVLLPSLACDSNWRWHPVVPVLSTVPPTTTTQG